MPEALPTIKEIQSLIHLVRGQRVMLDSDLAGLYGVSTGQLNRAVKRNIERFPLDFMYQLSEEEADNLKCQIGISSSWGGRRRSFPQVFTEQGVAMLSSVLKSRQAALANVEIMRVFVRMREVISAHRELSHKIAALEQRVGTHDREIGALFQAINELMKPPEPETKHRLGF